MDKLQIFQDLLARTQKHLQNVDLTTYNLISEVPPYVGGDFDVELAWETVVYPLKNQNGVNVEIKVGFEICTDGVLISPRVSAWHQNAPFGEFPVHTFATRESEEPLYHQQLGESGLSDLINEALTTATLIEPTHLTDESWANVVIPDPSEGEGTDRSKNASKN